MTALIPPGWAERRLLIQRCASCGHHQYYPRPICLACDSSDLALVEATGRGRIYSFTVVHRSVNPRFEAPYTIALVDLEEGPRLLTHIVDCEPDEVRCDAPVRLAWLDRGPDLPLPIFTPIRDGAPPEPSVAQGGEDHDPSRAVGRDQPIRTPGDAAWISRS